MIEPLFTLGVSGVVRRRDRVLLVRIEYTGPKWQLPGGYVERGESLTHALYREIEEELGVEARILGVVGTYFREFARNINVVFLIDVPVHQIKVDGYEVLEARFFGMNDLPDGASLRTRRVIHDVLNGQRSRVVVFRTHRDSGSLLGEGVLEPAGESRELPPWDRTQSVSQSQAPKRETSEKRQQPPSRL